jgi:hypothetical protein
MTSEQIIDFYLDRLRRGGAQNVDEYELHLRQNATSGANLNNFLSESKSNALKSVATTGAGRPRLDSVPMLPWFLFCDPRSGGRVR